MIDLPTPRHTLVPQHVNVQSWSDLEPLFQHLEKADPRGETELLHWMNQFSELEAFLEEELGWRYIRMTCDTTNKEHEERFLTFVQDIEPQMAPVFDRLNRKLLDHPDLPKVRTADMNPWLRKLAIQVKLYREENVPLQAEIQTLSQQYGAISGAMTITWEGKEITLQQAANHLKNPDRAIRERAFRMMQERRQQDADALDGLFDNLLKLRHQVAVNAGYANFRDYMFDALGRFDYGVKEVMEFHEAIQSEVVPMVKALDEKRLKQLGMEALKPWDMDVDPEGKPGLHPFQDGAELLAQTKSCFKALDPFFIDVVETMDAKGHFDLDSRIGKAPGGYNYPLPVTGLPFIFMNAAGAVRDVETMVHEAGHAFHSVLTNPLPFNGQKSFPSEVAELASMSMELITHSHWDAYFPNQEDARRAKQEHLEGIIRILPWIATVDAFQHWIYTNPKHTAAERRAEWTRISASFSTGMVDWSGMEAWKATGWHKQLHIFEVPFYYIEYGMAQLGAIGVWKNVVENREEGLARYKKALALGYTKPIPTIYETAGVHFNFTATYLKALMQFVKTALYEIQ